MKNILTSKTGIVLATFIAIVAVISINGCKASASVAGKSGAQLWGENCRRCHNAPDPNTYSGEQWITVGMHMQSRALLTEQEKNKIVEFLKQ